MDLFRRDRCASKIGYSLAAIIAFYLLIMTKSAESMAERPVVCTGTLYHYNNLAWFMEKVKRMRNCTVLEGGLHISFLNFTKYSEILENQALFPKLREISGFLLLTGSDEVESLAHLFPRLSVIRGEPPLKDKDFHISLLIARNKYLKRIGLNIAVLNGSVHIRDNPGLCPGYELDEWKKYSPNVEINIKNNMPCVLKDSSKTPWWCRGNYSSPTWPSPPSTSCHELCLGGCTGPSSNDCFVCRAFQHQDTCVEACPSEKRLSLPTHRCISDDDCKQRGSLNIFPNLKYFEENARFLIQKNSCVPGCQKPFEPRYEYGFLKCKKPCSTEQVSTVFELEEYRNCTYTLSPLKIVPAPHECERYNASEWEIALERYLGKIKKITGGLHIRRLHGVQNLHFLRSLETITTTNDTKFSLLIDDNSSLNRLFTTIVTKRLKILPVKNGSVTIWNNPMLCPQEISSLQKKISWEILDSKNGRRAQCDKTSHLVETKIYNITATSVMVGWDPQSMPIIYSTAYFRPAPHNTTFSILAMNFPSSEFWYSVDLLGNYSDNGPFVLNRLNSSSRYAFYIEAVGDTVVMRSKITYFRTKDLISRPCAVTVWPYPTILSPESSLKIEWAVPTRTASNERVVYLVTGEYIKDSGSPCSSKQFCPISISDYTTVLKERIPWMFPVADRRQIIESCCDFSDILDKFLDKLDVGTPSDRFPKDLNFSIKQHFQPLAKILTKNKTDTGNSTGRLVYFAVFTPTEAVVVSNLMPFGSYRVKVYTCSVQQNNSQDLSWESMCSPPGYGAGRSSALEKADTFLLSPFAMPFNDSSSFVLQWEKRKETNSRAWYTVTITDEKKSQETLCRERDKIKFEDKSAGIYNICVTIESLAKSGDTRCITYSSRGAETHPWRNFILTSLDIVAVIIIGVFAVRRIQRSKPDDRALLSDEDFFDTDVRFSEIPVHVDDMGSVL